jgi:hypothetical protein
MEYAQRKRNRIQSRRDLRHFGMATRGMIGDDVMTLRIE